MEPIISAFGWWNQVGAFVLQGFATHKPLGILALWGVQWLDAVWFVVCIVVFFVIEWRQAQIGEVRHRLGVLADTARHVFVGIVLVVVVNSIKYLVSAQRPAGEFLHSGILGQGSLDMYASFPSLHAALFMYLGCVAGVFVQRRWFRLLCAVMVVWISLSRVVFGYHYPVDIFAGWIVGLIAFLVAHRKQYN